MSDNKNLKPGWKVWRFDQMATNVNVRIDNPSESGMEHYIGLEHLDADSLKIRRWGTPDDVEATKLMFKKGDIIFGRRRAYQRKLGVAEFDGICSAHAMVLRAKPEVVLPEFLPFFMQSNLFMKRAVEISVGSLSPTINWKTMAIQEFALPPKDEQSRIVDMLFAFEEMIESLQDAHKACDLLYRSLIEESYSVSSNEDEVTLAKLAGINPEQISSKESDEDRVIRYIDIGTISRPKVIGEISQMNLREASSRARRKVRDGDLIISTVRPNLKSFARITSAQADCIVSTGFAVIRANQGVSPSFLFHAFFSSRFDSFCTSKNEGTSYPAIKASDLAKFVLPRLSLENQLDLGSRLDQLECTSLSLETRFKGARNLATSRRDSLMEAGNVV